MQNFGPASDEPTRLANIVSPMFLGQTGWVQELQDGAKAELLAGADAQDDCAVFRVDGPMEVVLGSDYVRGPKFRLYELGYLSNYDIGYYLAMANLSDIAAMGALPIALLSVIRYPKSLPDTDFTTVIEGIRDACREVNTLNVGGDIGSAERIILSASAMGIVEQGRSLLRGGARPGDRLCVTGPTGIAASAQRYFGIFDSGSTKLPDEREELLISAWRRPRALVRQGRCLSTSGVVTSCQDTSDGLKAGIQSLAVASSVGFMVDESALPIADIVTEVAVLTDCEITSLIMGDSVDFQLVFTVAEEDVPQLSKIFADAGLQFFSIGHATEAHEVSLRRADGTVEALPGTPWRHAT
ncbi:thiamine-phosphate kinase [Actinomadura macrotermitis]|uniref:Thiamine-monophosphate kinase n=1 Tax=Actinomadura macrotermitis TaxID=2585200 RepID=A0A7K0BVI2_9ACTN|nr:thiamine-phosphate kinase [Actinomadura macrotermitis]MQY05183.1 Thiamine-monophosphate kinase [Actinomadura macrotermitis]